MVLSGFVHRVTVALAVGGTQVAATFGARSVQVVAYLLAGLLGALLYLQGDRRVVGTEVFPTLIVGYAVGTAVSLLVGTGLLMWSLGAPWDLALWRIGILMWGSWAGIAFMLVSAYFVVGAAVASV